MYNVQDVYRSSHNGIDPLDNPWIFRSCTQLSGFGRFAGRHAKYWCDGNALILPFNYTKATAKKRILELKEGVQNKNNETVKWVDQATRLLIVEFVTYNKHLRMFVFSQFGVEFTAGGGIFPSHMIYSFKLHQWNDRHPVYWLFYFIYFLYVIAFWGRFWIRLHYRTIERMEDKDYEGIIQYFRSLCIVITRDPWIPFDFVNLSIFLAVFGIRFTLMNLGLSGNSLLQVSEYPTQMEFIAHLFYVSSFLEAMNALLVYSRIFYYLRLNDNLNVLTNTIERALPSLIGILVVFFIVFIGFTLMSLVAFGPVSEEFKDFERTVSTLSRMIVGDFDYISLRGERRDFTGVFFVLFIIICVFLLLNMIIAVLSSAFDEVEDEKYDFGPLTSVMKFSRTEMRGSRFEIPKGSVAIYLEVKYWFKVLVANYKYKMGTYNEAEYETAIEMAANENPRIYWQNVENSLLNRSLVIDFKAKLSLTPVDLKKKLNRIFGKADYEALETHIIKPACITEDGPRMSQRQLILDLVEYQHKWKREVGQYCDMVDSDEDSDDESRPLSPLQSLGLQSVADLGRRVDELKAAMDKMPDAIAQTVLEALRKGNPGVTDPY